MRFTFLPSLALALLLATSGARAHDCVNDVEDAVTLETELGTFYVWNDMCQPSCLFSVWIIEERNGHPGLQRADPGWDADAGTYCEPDTARF